MQKSLEYLLTWTFLDGLPYTDSAFLVLSNRLFAFTVGLMCLFLSQENTKPAAPFYSYGIVSMSNLISTLCQYESLKYVTFAAQTIAKSTKMIPTLFMGRIVFKNPISSSDLSIACIISLGVTIFMLGGVS